MARMRDVKTGLLIKRATSKRFLNKTEDRDVVMVHTERTMVFTALPLLSFFIGSMIRPFSPQVPIAALAAAAAVALLFASSVQAAPLGKPYVAFRTDPFDQTLHHALNWDETNAIDDVTGTDGTTQKQRAFRYDEVETTQCPLQFSIGLARKLHYYDDTTNGHTTNNANAIKQSPVLQTVFPARGPGKQVIYATAYEHVDLLSPAVLEHHESSSSSSRGGSSGSGGGGGVIKEALVQAPDFPLLFESSAFAWSSPILHDVNGDGVMDIIVSDYDGGISISSVSKSALSSALSASSASSASSRYFHHTQVPRLYVRRSWVEALVNASSSIRTNGARNTVQDDNNNITTKTTTAEYAGPNDPYHSYFEYYYSAGNGGTDQAPLIRGESANVLGQKSEDAVSLQERRSRQRNTLMAATAAAAAGEEATVTTQRRLQEVVNEGKSEQEQQQQKEEVKGETPKDEPEQHGGGGGSEERAAASKDGGSGKEEKEKHREPKNQHHKSRGGHHKDDDADAGDDWEIPELDQLHRTNDDDRIPVYDAAVDDDVPPPETEPPHGDDKMGLPGEGGDARDGVDVDQMHGGDDMAYGRYGGMMDDYHYDQRMHGRGGGGDDMYSSRRNAHSDYYDNKYYIRIPPHILTTPVLAEVPKLYGNTNDKEDILLVAVSYYLDEDEYEGFITYKRFQLTDQGDETEARRGTFVASAIMGYILGDSGRWAGQTHLDLSTDFTAPENVTVVGVLPIREDLTEMSAFALSSPTVADLDGDGSPEVIVGTSMGMIYAFDARQMFKRDKWPVQLKRPVEHRIMVEDVMGDTNLEVFVSDIGGTVVCLNHEAQILWHRNLPASLDLPDDSNTEISASSPMTMGDVNGDGLLDIVQVIRINKRSFIFALSAASGKDLPRFPIELDGEPAIDEESDQIHQKLPQPLLVDLHADQSFLNDYLRRNGTAWKQRTPSSVTPAPHGGSSPGLHIVQPHGEDLFIVEGFSGCTQKVSIGEEVSAMVQVDDVHATSKLDLVIATESGNIVTLESMATYHPLNTWTGGEVRGRGNLHAHGYSASQGIFVHSVSRQFVDIFGVYVPVTFEIFDNRPNIQNEPAKRKYLVEIRDGPSWKRVLWRNEYTQPGVYTDRVYIRYGPGYYTLSVSMLTSHGLIYEDMFSIGYNVRFLDGFGILLWLPLLVAAVVILFCGAKKANWDDDEFDGGREGQSLGILGRALPT